MGKESEALEVPTAERAYEFTVVEHKPVVIHVPEAPGFTIVDESDDAQRKLYRERYDALEKALRTMIEGLPFTYERFTLLYDYDRSESYGFVRMKFRHHTICEFAFYPDGYSRMKESSDSMPEWDAKSWRKGAELMLASLRQDSEHDMQNGALRLEQLNACKIE